MSRRIDIDADSGDLLIHFDYDEVLVEQVRDLPGRRWSPQRRAWTVPSRHVRDVVDGLAGKGFRMSRRVKEALDRVPAPSSDGPAGSSAAAAMTPTQLNVAISRALRARFADEVWIVGEISGLKPRGGETRYFELVERDGDGPPLAKVAAVIFGAAARRIAQRIAKADAGIELVDGVQVCVRARVDHYAQTGRTQVIVEDIDPLHTLGKLAQEREKILADLRQMGIAELNRQIPEPLLPLRVGLITSSHSEGYNDFVSELRCSGFGFQVQLADVPVQGRHVEAALVGALTLFARMERPPDLLIIVRGGGAKTDLAAFDSRSIAEAICRHPLPVVVGIGHHRDRTAVDEVARSVKTPTAAAAYLVERVQNVAAELRQVRAAIVGGANRQVRDSRAELDVDASRFRREVRHRVSAQRLLLGQVEGALRERCARRTRRASEVVTGLRERLAQTTRARLRAERRTLDQAGERLDPARYANLATRQRRLLDEVVERLERGVAHHLGRRRERLDGLEARRRGLDPTNVLRRGFAIVRGPRGKLLHKSSQTTAGDRLTIRLADGHVIAETLESNKADP